MAPVEGDGAQHRALGGNIQIVGSAEHLVKKLLGSSRPAAKSVQVAIFDFAPDLEFFTKRCCR